ncbi:ATP-binding protein [Microvirga sp. 2MCAF38]|uniref:ATP-binding protein n=1 Tax=Microvirga sp. 2MCAF38 TaxID=3232989 RepID=UPI003F96B223
MTVRVVAKWRPTLGLIVFVVLSTVMTLPLVGLFFFRLYENELIRQTEAELIAQSAVLAAIFAREVESTPGLVLGDLIPELPSTPGETYHPIEASLDLTSDDLLGRRPEARPPSAPLSSAFAEIGARLQPVALRTQSVTLAGFRILDPKGIVIAGREEVGLSLAHVDEVAQALQGHYHAVLRTRITDQPPPPLYSISRGTGVRVFSAMPVVVQGQVAGVIYASRTPNNIIKHVYGEQRKLILAGLTVLGATLAIGLIFFRAISRPIHALVARAVELGNGRREALQPLAHYGTREIALLSQSFIDMAERLHERSDYIATFAAHVSHELKTPLTSIQGAAELLRDDVHSSKTMTRAERMHFLDNIVSDTNRLTTMLHRLRELARADNPQTDGTASLSTVIAELKSTFPGLDIQAEGRLEQVIGMSGENATIVLSHLADNAIRHNATSLRISAEANAGEIRVAVRDNGDRITLSNRGKIFEAFFTTRRESGGTGMGLGIVRAMLHAHDGSIDLLTSEEGAAFEIRIRMA